MTYELRTEPIDTWPLPDTKDRPFYAFTAPYPQTMTLLHKELAALDARGVVVLQVVTRNGGSDLRRDGALRAQARIEHPGVRLSLESKHGPLTYATDAFDGDSRRPGWQQNLRAIALGLEALRKVDRYGITSSAEQYRGFLQIEAGGRALGDTGMTVETALDIILDESDGWIPTLRDVDDITLAGYVREARKQSHPDRNGGNPDRARAVNVAVDVLRAAGRIA